MSKLFLLLCLLVCAFSAFGQNVTEGSLFARNQKGVELGACPLKSTAVKTEISGFVARVRVTQEFENAFSEPIEAVYTFPLGQNGAVDEMTMHVGTRTIRGKIMKREEAREVYEAAKSEGKTASILDQERPNIFTQAVANIMPGEKVLVEISYVETLKYEDGAYEFVFPMTVGPRYVPGQVADATKILPPVTTRNGSDITMDVTLNAGVPVEAIRSTSHEIVQTNLSPNAARITLAAEKTIPNKDFILRYDVTGAKLRDAVLAHRDERGGYFTLILQPPDKVASEDRTPKEIVFVLDTSGSMGGFPIEKAKEAMMLSLDGLYPDDTFNLITFAGDTNILFDGPVPATRANLDRAREFLASRQGGGGTEMMKAIKAALDPSDSKAHLRIVCFMTDGYVGNEEEIIAEIGRHPQARVFSFGIGSSVNRFLLDKMAEAGRGEVEYVALNDDGSKAARRFYERVRTPLLTDLSIEWNGMPVADVYPSRLTDLFSAKPVIVHGRYTKPGAGSIKLKGRLAGQPYERDIAINLPENEAANDSLASLWARTRIGELSSDKLRAAEPAKAAEFDKLITQIGLEYRLLTNFTSFVAVEERVVNHNGQPTRVEVPVNIPEGVNIDTAVSDRQEVVNVMGSGGGGGRAASGKMKLAKSAPRRAVRSGKGSGRGIASGVGYGSGSGSGNVSAMIVSAPPAPPPVGVAADKRVNANISRGVVAELPKGATFGSLLKINPGYQVDGASGSENTFVIDGKEVTNLRTAGANGNEAISGRAEAIAEPVYPDAAKTANVLGEVEVEIAVDRDGTVTAAKAIAGPPELREASEAAALLSKFAPSLVAGRPIRLAGVIAYKFTSAEKVEIAVKKMAAVAPSDEDRKDWAMADKLHGWLYEAADRVRKGVLEAGANEARFVRDGRASVEVRLAVSNASVLERLRSAGFAPAAEAGGVVRGSVPLERLGDLALVPEVKLVLPIVR